MVETIQQYNRKYKKKKKRKKIDGRSVNLAGFGVAEAEPEGLDGGEELGPPGNF